MPEKNGGVEEPWGGPTKGRQLRSSGPLSLGLQVTRCGGAPGPSAPNSAMAQEQQAAHHPAAGLGAPDRPQGHHKPARQDHRHGPAALGSSGAGW